MTSQLSNRQFVAFDAFGTLIHGHGSPSPYATVRDALGLNYEAFRNAAMTQDRSLREIAESLLGRPLDVRESEVVEKATLDILADCSKIHPYPETLPILAMLRDRGIPYGIVSNLARPYELPLLAALGEFAPPVIIYSFAVGSMKPERAIYNRFCERMGCTPEQTLFVGDRLKNDLLMPEKLGFRALLLRRNGTGRDDPSKSIGREIADLFGILPALNLAPRGLEELLPQRAAHRELTP